MEATLKAMPIRNAGAPEGRDATAVSTALATLQKVLKEENALLESGGRLQLQPFITQKNQLLKELMLLQRQYVEVPQPEHLRQEMGIVRKLLADNERLLGLQLAALRDISQTLTKVIADEESDGTYARAQA